MSRPAPVAGRLPGADADGPRDGGPRAVAASAVSAGAGRPPSAGVAASSRPPGTAGSPRTAAPRLRAPRGAVTAADGLLLVDKPAGPTSHDVVAAVRRLAATRRVGHAGTLDPMATGLLVLGVGRATRLLTHLVGADKTYEATVRLGQETLTEDAQGEVTASAGCPAPDSWPGGGAGLARRLDDALRALTGEIMQVPSAVSAIKVDGVRSYARVRGGQGVELPARAVSVHALARRGDPRPARAGDGTPVVDLDLHVDCSSGTYVRAIARDLGAALGCGAHLTALRRTRVGPFDVGEAAGLDALCARVEADAATARPEGLSVLPMAAAARRCFASVELTVDEARALGHGRMLPADLLDRARTPERPVASKAAGRVVAGLAPDGAVVALLVRQGSRARPVTVLAPG